MSLNNTLYSASVCYEFIPSLPDELSITTSEVLRVLAEYDDGWVLCANKRDEKGMVPRECLDRTQVQEQNTNPQRTPPSFNLYVAIVRSVFIPSDPDELDITTATVVRVLAEFDDGWALCANERGEQGVVPLECLEGRPMLPVEFNQQAILPAYRP